MTSFTYALTYGDEIMARIGRNDPCPCKSGRKYKHCCIGKNDSPSSVEMTTEEIQFECGSYGPPGRYMPALLIHRETKPDEWKPQTFLVCSEKVFSDPEDASAMAKEDIEHAVAAGQRMNDLMATTVTLRDAGYKPAPKLPVATDNEQQPGKTTFKPSEKHGETWCSPFCSRLISPRHSM